MKLVAAGLMCVVFAAVFAQDQPDNRVHYACVTVTPARLLECVTTLGPALGRHLVANDPHPSGSSIAEFARTAKVGDRWFTKGSNDLVVITFAASGIQQKLSVYRLTGEAEIHTTAMTLTADDAVYHSDTGEIEAHGNVRVRPVAPVQ